MSLPKVYLETTIPSYLTARRSRDLRLAADQLATQEWWDECRHGYELFISQMVLKEARRGDSEFATARLAQMAGIPLLSDLHEAAELANRLLTDRIVPDVAADDATHIALAAAHGMDYLLTWNCQRPPALPFRAVLSHRLSRSARLHTHQQRPQGARNRGGVRGLRLRLPPPLHTCRIDAHRSIV